MVFRCSCVDVSVLFKNKPDTWRGEEKKAKVGRGWSALGSLAYF